MERCERPKVTRREGCGRTQAILSLLMLVLLVSSACGGPQTLSMPENLPPVEAQWRHLGAQVPDSADALLLVSFDESIRDDFSQILETPDLLGDVSETIADATGIDVSQENTFDQLGLRLGGGAAFFLDSDRWIVLADLLEDEPMRQILAEIQSRNPDLSMTWRDVDGEDVLSIWTDADVEVEPQLHLMVTGEQLVVLYDQAESPSLEAIDEMLRTVLAAEWEQNVFFNARVWDAVTLFGGDSWALWFADVPPLLTAMPQSFGYGMGSALGGDPPTVARCQEVQDLIGQVVPYALGSVDRDREVQPGQTIDREIQQVLLKISAGYRDSAGRLLRPSPVSRDALESNALISTFLSLDRETLAAELGSYADASGCYNAALLVGLLGEAGRMLGDSSDFGAYLNGFVGAALFDVRNTGGVPFADLFVMLGSDQPAALSQSLRDVLEAELGLYGSPEVTAGFQSVHYRFALLYRLGLYEGYGALGVSVGRVDEPYLISTLHPPEEPESAFFGLTFDGQRMTQVYDVAVEIGVAGLEDEEMVEAQQEMLEASLAELRRLLFFRATGTYNGDSVVFEIIEETLAE